MELCYLLAFPDPATAKAPPSEQFKGLKDAPYFQPVDIELHTLGEETVVIEECGVKVMRQRYDGRVQMVDCRFEMETPLADSALRRRERLEDALQKRYIPATFRENGLYEEYIILLVPKTEASPDEWVDGHALEIAKFFRSQREVLDPNEVEESLSSRVRYSKRDLTVVDWDGAVIVSPDADFQSDILLLKVGNYQLLRYRMLNGTLESMLDRISGEFLEGRRRPLGLGPTRNTIRRIIQLRLEVMIDFERTEQNLLLIGDWYTAKLYEAIRQEFYLEDWKSAVRGKLENLEDLIQTIQENFSLTWSGLLEMIQLAGWIILLIGYFILYFVEIGQ